MKTLEVSELDLESLRSESHGGPVVLTIRESPVAILSAGDPFGFPVPPPDSLLGVVARLLSDHRCLPSPVAGRVILARRGRPIAELIPLQSIDKPDFDSDAVFPSATANRRANSAIRIGPTAVPAGLRTIDVDHWDAEDLAYCLDADFWKGIQARRESPTMSREQLEACIERDDDPLDVGSGV